MDGNLHGVLHGRKWIMFRGLLDVALGYQKEVLVAVVINSIVISFENYYIAMVGI